MRVSSSRMKRLSSLLVGNQAVPLRLTKLFYPGGHSNQKINSCSRLSSREDANKIGSAVSDARRQIISGDYVVNDMLPASKLVPVFLDLICLIGYLDLDP